MLKITKERVVVEGKYVTGAWDYDEQLISANRERAWYVSKQFLYLF